ncbi:ABC transporter ATP-binding protein [Serinicoccus sp. CNJ-927]|uniref:ABC transporter ATP-binding protein n=1 Tax=Serinicoccus sp. CNJ-927 TaxID=1904970 RepID=UPI0009F99D67|nr:ABC transporter ATP-binding protein [Serinicoccus sp. CNJ-927]
MTGASPAGAVVRLAGVSVTFAARRDPVLRDVSLRLAPGEQVVLLGPSGSGKSTVLHTVTGVVPHTVPAQVEGEVTVAGTPTGDTTVVERSRHLGVLAQDPSAGVCLPVVEQELALPMENDAVEPGEIDARIDAALEMVGVAHLRARATSQLSGGESQRVALAAATVTRPQVLLLDEPTSMLDGDGVGAVRAALSRVVGRQGAATVLVEHRLDEWAGDRGVAALPGRAVVLDESGRVAADGPTEDVLALHGPRLHAMGCWLPLETELRALTGAAGGLAHADNVALLERLADQGAEEAGPAPVPDPLHPAARTDDAVLLSASGLAVARTTLARRRREPAARPVLAGVDLQVRPGEVVAVLGANGVGKTTLLLTLAGLLPPAAGGVAGPRPGLVFQNPEHQFVASSVRAEVAHGLRAVTDGGLDGVVDRQLRRHRLEHLADQNPFRLSGGEKRRVSLAAMLAHERRVLLADEPTLGLDRRDAIAVASTLADVAAGGGAVVLASHDLRLVATVATRVLVLGEGGVLTDAPTARALGDEAVLDRARVRLPALVGWLVHHRPADLRTVLRGLDRNVAVASPAPDRPGGCR